MMNAQTTLPITINSYMRKSKHDVDYGSYTDWLKPVRAVATVQPDVSTAPTEIGEVVAYIVNRDFIRNTFHSSMEEPSAETMRLALTIFDRYGRLNRDLIKHTVRRGSGIWGPELDKGNFVLIEDVKVEREWRRKGIGSKLVLHVLSKAMAARESPRFAFTYPGITEDLGDDKVKSKDVEAKQMAIRQSKLAALNNFFRSLQFRRIGLTDWFALAQDEHHPSRQLSWIDDPDPVLDSLSDADSDEEKTIIISGPSIDENGHFIAPSQTRVKKSEARERGFGKLLGDDDGFTNEERHSTTAILKRMHPLHYAIKVLEDKDSLNFIRAHTTTGSRKALNIKARNGSGETILHAAAIATKPESLDWILHSSRGSKLARSSDHKGYTPLEALQAQLERQRLGEERAFDRTKCIADRFDGHSDAETTCLLKLLGVENATTEQKQRVQFGCSCGQCISGFISPHMMKKLCKATQLLCEFLTKYIKFKRISWPKWLLTYLPSDLQLGFRSNVILRRIFTAVACAIFKCLSEKIIPYKQPIVDVLRQSTCWSQLHVHYFQRGGSVAAVMNVIIDLALKYNTIERTLPEAKDSMSSLEIPICRNDDEFEFVRRHCIDDDATEKHSGIDTSVVMPWVTQMLRSHILREDTLVQTESPW